GGRDDFLRLGVSYDTRDFEPDPNTGIFLDAALDAGTVALGSQYDYARFLVAARGYVSPFPIDLVLAGRAVFEVQTKGAPFFSMDTLPFTEDPRLGLGGHRTMRGFRPDRFVAVSRLEKLVTRCEADLTQVSAARAEGDKLAAEAGGDLELRWRIAVVRAAIAHDPDSVRELYGELVDRYRAELDVIKPLGE